MTWCAFYTSCRHFHWLLPFVIVLFIGQFSRRFIGLVVEIPVCWLVNFLVIPLVEAVVNTPNLLCLVWNLFTITLSLYRATSLPGWLIHLQTYWTHFAGRLWHCPLLNEVHFFFHKYKKPLCIYPGLWLAIPYEIGCITFFSFLFFFFFKQQYNAIFIYNYELFTV